MNVTGVILAAGLGTRLRPSTDFCPKPLIPVGGVEPLFFALSSFHRMGVKRVVINAHYLHEQVSSSLREWESILPGMSCRVSVEAPQILGTGGGILKILKENRDWFEGRGLLLQNGDTLANIPLERLVADKDVSTFGISLRPEHLKKYKPLWVEGNGAWAGIGPVSPGEHTSPAHFLGVHHLSRRVVERLLSQLPATIENTDLFNGIYRPLTDENFEFKACPFLENRGDADFWFDMNTPEYLLEAQRYVLESLLSSTVWREILLQRYPGIREIQRGVWVCSASDGDLRTFHAPAVMIESRRDSLQRAAGALVLGPHASLVYERGELMQSSAQPSLEIRNSVVMVGGRLNGALPKTICNEIRVV